jgi:hypothetical protein
MPHLVRNPGPLSDALPQWTRRRRRRRDAFADAFPGPESGEVTVEFLMLFPIQRPSRLGVVAVVPQSWARAENDSEWSRSEIRVDSADLMNASSFELAFKLA